MQPFPYVQFRKELQLKDDPIAQPVGAVKLRSDRGRDSGKHLFLFNSDIYYTYTLAWGLFIRFEVCVQTNFCF
jgi:hypothetical protein